MTKPEANSAYLVGGGIASLAAATLLIRDAGYAGQDIHIFETSDILGGSLDGSGNMQEGYVVRGGRMFEAHFACTFDLLQQIPTVERPDVSVTEEIKQFTREVIPSSKCRLVDNGVRIEAPEFQLSTRDKWDLLRLSLVSEDSIGELTIAEYFSPHFLQTNFWIMWCSMFAFQAWHSVAEFRRYMRRFLHLLPGFNRIEGIYRTRLNQYDSIVRPLAVWLGNSGVNFHLRSPVTALEFDSQGKTITQLTYQHQGAEHALVVGPHGKVFITLGSMTEASTLGDMTQAPRPQTRRAEGSSWSLWEKLAAISAEFGRPEVFAGDPDKTVWESFTVTLRDSEFFDYMQAFTGNSAGTGGLVTFKNSSWLLSVVLAHQPHFSNQAQDVWVFWGYGLNPQREGDRVKKPMLKCTGSEILAELAHHLDLGGRASDLFATANCIPCLMPYITAQFMPRPAHARPRVIPNGASNYAFLGQFCELPEDTVFTVEYSVRTAQTAVYQACAIDRDVTAMYRGFKDPRVVLAALKTIARNGRSD